MAMLGKSWLTWWPKAWIPFARRNVPSAYDYDAILESLSEEIEAVEATLLDIKARRRRAVSSVLRVIFTAWILVILLLWGYSTLVHNTYDRKWEWYHSFYLVGVVLGTPAMLVVLHHVITLWFRRLEKAQESHLQALRLQRRQKINEIKKATDFEHLRSLLERYDDETPSSEQLGHASNNSHPQSEAGGKISGALRGKASFRSLRGQVSKESLRPHTQHATEPRFTHADDSKKVAAPAITGMPVMGVQKAPAPRGWMDKVADMILGTDPYNASPEDHQYALICRNCFRHNGLVPKNELNEIQYVCPHCSTFNTRRPSSKPVSSPFNKQQEFASNSSGAHSASAEPKRNASITTSPHSQDDKDTVSVKSEPDTTSIDTPQTQRRSARLRNTYETSDKASESMQVDE